MKHHHTSNAHDHHEASLIDELVCHFPYAAFSIAAGFVVLSLLQFVTSGVPASRLLPAYHTLFHAFHYLHLVFAVTGTYVTFRRFSPKSWVAVPVALFFPALFCTLSDVALPSIAGSMLGVHMDMHVCFFNWQDTLNVLPFMFVGIINGILLSDHVRQDLASFSLTSHFIHILISSLAALFYIVSFGFDHWSSVMGILFALMVGAVVVPCTISDVVVPLYFARLRQERHERHHH